MAKCWMQGGRWPETERRDWSRWRTSWSRPTPRKTTRESFFLVALRDSLSNMNPPLVRLLEAVEGGLVAADEHAVALDEDACVAREMAENRILSPDEVMELVESYRRGAAVLELARRFGVHRHTVDRHLQRAGIVKRPMVRMGPELFAKAIELYEQGLSVAKVGKTLGVSASTVYSTFAREGVRMRASKRSTSS